MLTSSEWIGRTSVPVQSRDSPFKPCPTKLFEVSKKEKLKGPLLLAFKKKKVPTGETSGSRELRPAWAPRKPKRPSASGPLGLTPNPLGRPTPAGYARYVASCTITPVTNHLAYFYVYCLLLLLKKKKKKKTCPMLAAHPRRHGSIFTRVPWSLRMAFGSTGSFSTLVPRDPGQSTLQWFAVSGDTRQVQFAPVSLLKAP